jgi:hypothetical protein
MKILDKFLGRWHKRVDEKKKLQKAALDVPLLGIGGRYRPSREELEFERRGVRGNTSARLPWGSTLFRCRNGFCIKKFGHAPFSGPAPTVKAAERAALRNLGL